MGEDPATPGLLPKGIDPETVTIPQYRVNKTKQQGIALHIFNFGAGPYQIFSNLLLNVDNLPRIARFHAFEPFGLIGLLGSSAIINPKDGFCSGKITPSDRCSSRARTIPVG